MKEISEVPDRTGWLLKPLAELPPCPPFPQFTRFEADALDCIAGSLGLKADEFRRQLAAARVTDRINTKVGFYTRVDVDRSKCAPISPWLSIGGGHFELQGVAYGLALILSNRDGYLCGLEGITYGNSDLNGQELVDLRMISYQPI